MQKGSLPRKKMLILSISAASSHFQSLPAHLFVSDSFPCSTSLGNKGDVCPPPPEHLFPHGAALHIPSVSGDALAPSAPPIVSNIFGIVYNSKIVSAYITTLSRICPTTLDGDYLP
jgi:hypothetical protein